MGQYMEKDGDLLLLVRIQAMSMLPIQRVIDDVPEQLVTERVQKGVLCLKMRVKRGPAHISPVQDILDRDLSVALLCQQLCKRLKYRRSGLALSPVHPFSPKQFMDSVP